MAWQEKLSEDIKEISLYEPSPVYLHGYVIPFLVLYGAVLLTWSQLYGLGESWEALAITLAGVAVLNVVAVLCCVWSVHVRAVLTCKKVRKRAVLIGLWEFSFINICWAAIYMFLNER